MLFEPDGTVAFNALGTVAYSPATRKVNLNSSAMGQVGDFEFTALVDDDACTLERRTAHRPGRPLRGRRLDRQAAFSTCAWRV